MKFLWVIKKGRTRLYCERFSEAWEDWKSHDGERRRVWLKLTPFGAATIFLRQAEPNEEGAVEFVEVRRRK